MMVLILMNMEGHMLSHLGRELIVVGILFRMIGHQKKKNRVSPSQVAPVWFLELVNPGTKRK